MTGRALLVLLVVSLTSCSLAKVGLGAGAPDLGAPAPPDSSRADTGPGRDLGAGLDLSTSDLGALDAGPSASDLGPTDLGPTDLGPPDLGPPDLGPRDSGPPACDPLQCPGRRCQSNTCSHYANCEALHQALSNQPSGIYEIDPDGSGGDPAFRAACDMVSDSGGWTLVLKADGARSTFAYDSALWENDAVMGTPEADQTEAKLPGYLSIPFTKMRLVFNTSSSSVDVNAALILDLADSSLRRAITRDLRTSLGIDPWLTLVPGSRLQRSCHEEGLSVTPGERVRIGIVANEDNRDCTRSFYDSYLGIGGSQPAVPVGNYNRYDGAGSNDRTIVSFAWVWVR